MGGDLDDQPRRNNSYERNVTDTMPLLPFSVKVDRVNLRKLPETGSRIPSLTFGKPQGKQGPLTKSQNLVENQFMPDRTGKPPPFCFSSSQDASRRPFEIPNKSGLSIGPKTNNIVKSEERLFTFGENITIPTHIPTHPSSSPPILEEQANTPLKHMSYSQLAATVPNFNTQERNAVKSARRSSRTGPRERFSSMLFRNSQ